MTVVHLFSLLLCPEARLRLTKARTYPLSSNIWIRFWCCVSILDVFLSEISVTVFICVCSSFFKGFAQTFDVYMFHSSFYHQPFQATQGKVPNRSKSCIALWACCTRQPYGLVEKKGFHIPIGASTFLGIFRIYFKYTVKRTQVLVCSLLILRCYCKLI